MSRNIGQIHLAQHFARGGGIAVSRAADQAETGKVDDGIDRRLAVRADKELLYRRARIEPAGKDWHHVKANSFECGNRAVVMRSIAAKQIGAQQDETNGSFLTHRLGQQAQTFGNALLGAGMIHAHFGVFDRSLRLGDAPAIGTLTAGVAINQRAHHGDHVFIRARQPILQREEIGAHILRGAGDEFEQFGQAAQHLHLAFCRIAAGLGRAAQLLEQCQRSLGRRIHAISAHLGEAHDLACAHQAHHRIASLTARFERRQNHADLFIEENHRDDHDVRLGNRSVDLFQFSSARTPLGGGIQAQGDVVFGQFRLSSTDRTL